MMLVALLLPVVVLASSTHVTTEGRILDLSSQTTPLTPQDDRPATTPSAPSQLTSNSDLDFAPASSHDALDQPNITSPEFIVSSTTVLPNTTQNTQFVVGTETASSLPTSLPPQGTEPNPTEDVSQRTKFDPSNPYSHWDSDSEEQEKEMELRLQEGVDEDDDNNMTLTIANGDGNASPGRSYLLLLAGNSTIVRLRQRDFAKYLKLNLAARLSLEYDDVRVNRVVLAPPRLLVNVSVVTPDTVSENAAEEERSVDTENVLKEEAPLHMLAETNATLLELSGEEYHVVRLLPLRSSPPSKDPEEEEEEEEEEEPVASATIISDRHGDIELVIYTAVGGACALVILGTLMITLGKYLRSLDVQWPWRRQKSLSSVWNLPGGRPRHHRMGEDFATVAGAPPTVIYSGSFAARAAAASGASWVDDFQNQPGTILAEDPIKLIANNPMYADLEMGNNMMIAPNALFADVDNGSILSQHRQSPNSKLHIFSCRPGTLLIPIPRHGSRRSLVPAATDQKMPMDTHPLDVRIGEDKLGHDNPNYQT